MTTVQQYIAMSMHSLVLNFWYGRNGRTPAYSYIASVQAHGSVSLSRQYTALAEPCGPQDLLAVHVVSMSVLA